MNAQSIKEKQIISLNLEIKRYEDAVVDVKKSISNSTDTESVETRYAKTRQDFYIQEIGHLNQELNLLMG